MVSSRDNLYQRPNYAIDGVVPNYRRRPVLPVWITSPNIQPNAPPWISPPALPAPSKVFPDPLPMPPPLDVDPPENNPYNDPDYNPNSLVTKNSGGWPSRNWLLAYLDQFKGFLPDDRLVGSDSIQGRPEPAIDQQGIADRRGESVSIDPSIDQLSRTYRQLTSCAVR